MVAVVTSNGLGLFNSSLTALGGQGVLGQAGEGQSGGRALVNAATGNLVLQGLDQELSGAGADLALLRTYNSKGTLTSAGNGLGWSWDGERTVKFTTGTVNAVGSQVTRTTGDGATTIYTFDSNSNSYVSTDGDGANDFLTYSSSAHQWTWVDGDTRQTDVYGDSTSSSMVGRLASQTDESGRQITLGYNGSTLTTITDVASGQQIQLKYGGAPNVLQEVDTFELNVDSNGKVILDANGQGTVGTTPSRRVLYTYLLIGGVNCLQTVQTDLTPGNTTDSVFFVTTYGYDSHARITSVKQNDGSSTGGTPFQVSFTYDGSGRVATASDANGTQTFTYNAGSTDIRLSDAAGGNAQTWTYTYDSQQQLTQIQSPAVGGQRLATTFAYDSNGNVTQVTDGNGKSIIYQYDANGNVRIQRDQLGDTISRTYDANNQLLTETRYTTVDSAGLDASTMGIGSASGALTTHYVYDSNSRLRFTISAEGRISENRYDSGSGLLASTREYTADVYSATDFSLSALTTFVGGISDKTAVKLTELQYDFRGNLSQKIDYATINATTGAGVLDAGATETQYVYDGHGELVHSIAVNGATRTVTTQTSYVYDTLGRERTRTDGSGTQNTVYDDLNNKITVTNAATGEQVVSTYNGLDQLTSVSASDTIATGTPARTTKYFYDPQGRLQLTLDAQGGRRFSFYDAAGRLSAQVDAVGQVTGYTYDSAGNLKTQTQYTNVISDTSSWVTVDLATPPNVTGVVKHSFTVAASAGSGVDLVTAPATDRTTTYNYDDAERLQSTVDAVGTQATKSYDGASRVTQQQTGNRTTQYFYDEDDNLVGVLDPLGYLTENKYDAAGQLVDTVRYAARSPAATDVAAPAWVGVINQSAQAGQRFTYRIPATDADGDAMTFIVKPGTTLPGWLTMTTDADGVTLTGTPPVGLTTYSVSLRVDDGRGKTTDTTVQITVADSAPTWVALPDQVVGVNATGFGVVLPAASDTDGDTLTYSINSALLPPGMTFTASSRTISGTPTAPGLYTITARATDPSGKFVEKSFVLQVVGQGAPVWSAVAAQTATHTQAYSLALPAATDPGETLTYRKVSGPAWLNFNTTSLLLSGTPPMGEPVGAEPVVLEVISSLDGQVTRLTFNVTVQTLPPTWVSSLPGVTLSHANVNYTPPTLATDPEGKAITYSVVSGLPTGLQINASTGAITGTVAVAGTFNVVLRAIDPDGGSVTTTLTLTLIDQAPVKVGSIANQTVESTLAANWDIASAFSDPDGDPLTYSVVGGLPSGLQLVGSRFQWSGGASGTFTVTVKATDVSNLSSANQTFTLTVQSPPVRLSNLPDQSFTSGNVGVVQHFSAAASFSGSNLTYSISNTGVFVVSIDASTGLISFTVPNKQTRATSVTPTITVTDQFHQTATATCVINIAAAPTGSPPIVVPGGGLTAAVVAPAPMTPAPAPKLGTRAITPVVDVLASFRPSDTTGQHTRLFYDGQGRVVGTVDSQGFLTETVYDEQANTQQSIRYMQAVTVGTTDTLATLRTQALATSLATKKETTTRAFDGFGRVTSVTNAVDGTTTMVTTNEYDAAGRLTRQVADSGASDARATRTRYDAFGDVLGTLAGVGDAALLAAHATPTDTDIQNAMAASGMTYAYDSLGRTTQATDANGHVTLYYYDSANRLAATVNAAGEVTQTTYNSFGQVLSQRAYANRLSSTTLTTLQTAGGGAITTALTTALSALVDANHDRIEQLDYYQSGLLKTSTDGEGFVTANTYNAFYQLATQQRTIDSTHSTLTQYDYDLDGELLSTTGNVGGINFNTQTRYDAFGRVVKSFDAAGKLTQTTYDDVGHTVTVQDPLGRQGVTAFDALGRKLSVTDANGQVTTYVYDDTAHTTTVTLPSPESGVAAIVAISTSNVFGQTISIQDGRGNTTSYTYNKDGQLLTSTDALGNVTTNAYDASSRLSSTTDARGIITTYAYDAVNRVFERRVDPTTTSPAHTGLDLVCTYAFDAFGDVTTDTCGSGSNQGANVTSVTSYQFDRDGRQTKIIVDPSGLALTTTFSYDGLGNTTQVAQGTLSSPNQQVTQYVFDALGRRTAQIDAPSAVFGAGSANARDLTTTYRYDAAGRVSRVIDANGQSTWYVYNDDGQVVQTIDALGEVHQNAYDADGRVVQTRAFVNTVSTASFGDVVALQTPATSTDDQRTYTVYDNDGRVRFTLQADHATSWTISENRFDANGNVVESRRYDQFIDESRITADDTNGTPGVSVAEVRAELTTLGYDDTNASTLSGIARTHYAYDADNRLRFTVDSLGAISERVYGATGNLITTVRYANAPSLSAFDESTINGAVDRKNAANQVTHLVYDAAERLQYTVRTLAIDPATGNSTQQLVTEQRYDALGRVVQSIAYATKITGVLSDYLPATVASHLTVDAANDRETDFAYDAAGRQVYSLQKLVVSGTTKYVVSHRVYDAMGHVVQTTAYATAIAAPSDFKAATLDAAVVVDAANDRTTNFIYDTAGRVHFVVAADRTLSETVYDALGRVREQRAFDIKVDVDSPLTEAVLTNRRGAAQVGDGTTRGQIMTYDNVGQVRSSTDAMGYVESYTYDALGNRSTLTDKNGAVWTSHYDRTGRLHQQTAPAALVQLSTDSTPVSRALTTTFNYNALGELTSRVEGTDLADSTNGHVDERTTSYAYDTVGRQTSVTLPGFFDPATGQVYKTTATGRFQRVTSTMYDTLGNAVKVSVSSGASSVINEYKTFDNLGRQVFDVDALNHVTKIDYTSFSDQQTVTHYSITVSGTPANGVNWTNTELTTQTTGDTSARAITLIYDTLGRKTSVTQPTVASYFYGSSGDNASTITPVSAAATSTFEYNNFGELFHEAVALDTRTQDTWHYYDVMGRETRTIDALGFHTARSYDSFGNLSQVIEYASAASAGTSGVFTPPAVPADNTLDRITGFVYDARNEQTDVTRKNFTYTNAVLTNGVATSFADVTISRTGSATLSHTTYDGDGHVSTRTDALGHITTTTYDALGRILSVTEPSRSTAASASADPFVGQVNAAPVTSYIYNAFGQLLKSTRTPGSGAAGATLVSSTVYDFAGNAIGSTDANGNVSTRKYDYAGRVIEQTQHVHSQLGGKATGFSNAVYATVDYDITRRYAYDDAGQLTDTVDVFMGADGTTLTQTGTHTGYNAFGEVSDTFLETGSASTAIGALTRIHTAHYDYDNAGHVTTQTAIDGVTKYFYNLAGQVTRQEQQGNSSTSDGTGTRITESDYDLLGRVIRQRLPAFSTNQTAVSRATSVLITPVLRQSYDRWGNVTVRITGDFTFNGAPVSGDERTTTYDYNADNKLVAEHLPTVTAYREDGTLYSAAVTHESHYDLLGELVAEDDSVAGTRLRTRLHQYDAAGQLTLETDYSGHRTQYAYDSNGRRVGTKNALGTVFVDTFDSNGNQLTHAVLRQPDGIGAYVSGGTGTPTARILNAYEYDQANRRIASIDVVGDPDTAGNPLGFEPQVIINFAQYDERNYTRASFRIATTQHTAWVPAAVAKINACAYDALGNKTSETDASGNVQSWTYDTTDRTVGQRLTAVSGGRTTTYTYNDFGQLKSETYSGAGIAAGSTNNRTYAYFENGQLKDLTDNIAIGTAGATGGADFVSTTTTSHYEYDANGEQTLERITVAGSHDVLEVSDDVGNSFVATLSSSSDRTTLTTYDEQGRIATTSGATLNSLTYHYDEFGNRREIQAQYTPSLPAGATTLTQDRWFTYDADGRMLIMNGQLSGNSIVGVNPLNAQVSGGLKTVYFSYDSLGRRATAEEFEGRKTYQIASNTSSAHTDDWDEYHEERYTYDDLSNLTLTEQRYERLNGIFTPQDPNKDQNPPRALNDQPGTYTNADVRDKVDILGNIRHEQIFSQVTAGSTDTTVNAAALQRTITSTYGAPLGLMDTQSVDDATVSDHSRDTRLTNHYDANGVLRQYNLRHGLTGHAFNASTETGDYQDNYNYSYSFEAGVLKQTEIDITGDSTVGIKPEDIGSTVDTYDSRGNLIQELIQTSANTAAHLDATSTERSLTYDAAGHVLSKTEVQTKGANGSSPKLGEEQLYYVNGNQIATVGSGQLAGNTQFTALYSANSLAAPSTYTVSSGDTLAGIAQSLYGNADLWYVIAQANNVDAGPSDALSGPEIGRTYNIPKVASGIYNNASSFNAYNTNNVVNDTVIPIAAYTPPPGPSTCDRIAHMTAEVLVHVAAMAVGRIASLVLTPFITPWGAGAVSGALEDGLDQIGEIALGDKHGFDLGEFGASVAAGSLSAGADDYALEDPDALKVTTQIVNTSIHTGLSEAGQYLQSQVTGQPTDSWNQFLGNFSTQLIGDVAFGGDGIHPSLGSQLGRGAGPAQALLESLINPNSSPLLTNSSWWDVVQQGTTVAGEALVGYGIAKAKDAHDRHADIVEESPYGNVDPDVQQAYDDQNALEQPSASSGVLLADSRTLPPRSSFTFWQNGHQITVIGQLQTRADGAQVYSPVSVHDSEEDDDGPPPTAVDLQLPDPPAQAVSTPVVRNSADAAAYANAMTGTDPSGPGVSATFYGPADSADPIGDYLLAAGFTEAELNAPAPAASSDDDHWYNWVADGAKELGSGVFDTVKELAGGALQAVEDNSFLPYAAYKKGKQLYDFIEHLTDSDISVEQRARDAVEAVPIVGHAFLYGTDVRVDYDKGNVRNAYKGLMRFAGELSGVYVAGKAITAGVNKFPGANPASAVRPNVIATEPVADAPTSTEGSADGRLTPPASEKPIGVRPLRTNAPLGSDDKVTIIFRPGQPPELVPFHNPTSELIPFISDSEVLDVEPLSQNGEDLQHQGRTVAVRRTADGRTVIQQQAQKGCTTATSNMLIADAGGKVSASDLIRGISGNTNTIVGELNRAGFPANVTEIPPGNIERLADVINRGGPASFAVDGSVDGLGGHQIIVDEIDLAGKSATIRDPWHGWSVRITLDALQSRMIFPGDAIQIVR